MAYIEALEQGGFQFDNYLRNEKLIKEAKLKLPQALKTGTTICGLLFKVFIIKDGVVIAADTRATEGPIIADKNTHKVEKICYNIYACGAGTSADCTNVKEKISRDLQILELNTGSKPRLIAAATIAKNHLFRFNLADMVDILAPI